MVVDQGSFAVGIVVGWLATSLVLLLGLALCAAAKRGDAHLELRELGEVGAVTVDSGKEG